MCFFLNNKVHLFVSELYLSNHRCNGKATMQFACVCVCVCVCVVVVVELHATLN